MLEVDIVDIGKLMMRINYNLRETLDHVLSSSKKVNSIGSLALQTSHGQHLVNFKKKIIAE